MDTPNIAQKTPIIEMTEPGRYAYCACGLTQKGAFCDGSHRGTGFKPILEVIEAPRRIAWCGCRHSKKGARCDGSHMKL